MTESFKEYMKEHTKYNHITPLFRDWIKKFEKHDTPRGDLARDIARDSGFTKNNDREMIENYLFIRNACPECIRTFKSAWKRYDKEILQKLTA